MHQPLLQIQNWNIVLKLWNDCFVTLQCLSIRKLNYDILSSRCTFYSASCIQESNQLIYLLKKKCCSWDKHLHNIWYAASCLTVTPMELKLLCSDLFRWRRFPSPSVSYYIRVMYIRKHATAEIFDIIECHSPS